MAEVARKESGDYLHVLPHVRIAQAIVLARRGQLEEAEQQAREGVSAQRATEFVWAWPIP